MTHIPYSKLQNSTSWNKRSLLLRIFLNSTIFLFSCRILDSIFSKMFPFFPPLINVALLLQSLEYLDACSNLNTLLHSGRMDSKTIHSTIDAPPGIPGVSKNQIFFLQIKLLSSCSNISPKRHKLRKIIKIEKKSQKTLFS